MKAITFLFLAVLLTTELVVASQAKAAGEFDVGVIPSERGCPNGADSVRIRMDDEDRNNRNSRLGNIGAIISSANTDFFFCRVDGRVLRPLSNSSDKPETHYAVLKLGRSCPNGSREFSRHFDNEDTNNRNVSSGPLGPNVVSANTTLHFCLFRGGTTVMNSFPRSFPGTDAFGYHVFAQSSFIKALNSGLVHTDDEDSSGNKNRFTAPDAIKVEANRIISGGANTDLRIVQVIKVH